MRLYRTPVHSISILWCHSPFIHPSNSTHHLSVMESFDDLVHLSLLFDIPVEQYHRTRRYGCPTDMELDQVLEWSSIRSIPRLRRELSRSSCVMLRVLIQEGDLEPVAVAILGRCTICFVGVRPDMRRRGLGSEMVNHCLEELRSNGYSFVAVIVGTEPVHPSNHIPEFWKKNGFVDRTWGTLTPYRSPGRIMEKYIPTRLRVPCIEGSQPADLTISATYMSSPLTLRVMVTERTIFLPERVVIPERWHFAKLGQWNGYLKLELNGQTILNESIELSRRRKCGVKLHCNIQFEPGGESTHYFIDRVYRPALLTPTDEVCVRNERSNLPPRTQLLYFPVDLENLIRDILGGSRDGWKVAMNSVLRQLKRHWILSGRYLAQTCRNTDCVGYSPPNCLTCLIQFRSVFVKHLNQVQVLNLRSGKDEVHNDFHLDLEPIPVSGCYELTVQKLIEQLDKLGVWELLRPIIQRTWLNYEVQGQGWYISRQRRWIRALDDK